MRFALQCFPERFMMRAKGSNMKNFVLVSDLHTEFWPFDMPDLRDQGVSAVLLAGDAGAPGEMANVMIALREKTGCPVYAVEGNHDLWRMGRKLRTWQKIREHNDGLLADANASGPEMKILRGGEAVCVDGVRIIGASLWTDGKLGSDSPELIRETLMNRMNDYKKMTIHDEVRGLWRKAFPEDLFREHRKDLTAILRALDTPFDGSTIVMTHHVPLKELLTPIILDDDTELSAGYGSDLGEQILTRRFDAWVYGHSHQPEHTTFFTPYGEAIFASNPRGYPKEKIRFNPAFTISVSGQPERTCSPA